VPILQLDAGHFFADAGPEPGKVNPEAIVRNEWVIRGYSSVGHDVCNLSNRDVPFAQGLFDSQVYQRKTSEFPLISNFISANLKPARPDVIAPRPYVIKTISGPRLPIREGSGQAIRVGIIGLTQRAVIKGSNFVFEDPFVAIKRVLPEVRKQADIVVVLAYLSMPDTYKLAYENREIDVIISNSELQANPQPKVEQNTLVLFSGHQTKWLGELRAYIDKQGKISYNNRYVTLDHVIQDDPAAAKIVAEAHDAFTKVQQQQALLTARQVAVANSQYVTSAKCGECHIAQYKTWTQTAHSHAFATLEKRQQQYDPRCISCHSTGFGKGGFMGILETPQFANVQCEACHGPGKAHIQNPRGTYSKVGAPAMCYTCHDKLNSPDFNFETYWPKIRH